MPGRLKIHLKPKEQIYINGAAVKVDRKVALEFLNDAVFLLEAHVMDRDDATTPLRQHYYIVQSMLTDPGADQLTRQVFLRSHADLLARFPPGPIAEALPEVKELVERRRAFDALRLIRSLFEEEARLPSSSVGDRDRGRPPRDSGPPAATAERRTGKSGRGAP